MLNALTPGLAALIIAASTGAASATVNATLTPNTTSSASTTPVVLHVTGLATGSAVVVQRYADANGNGTVDTDEFRAEAFSVTDGQVTSIAGVRNTNIPGDEDGSANGEISIHMTPATGPELGRLAGTQLIRIKSPSSAFTTFTHTLTITQPEQSQSISGTVMDGATPVPYAAVALIDAADDGEFALGVTANATGQFTANAPAGSYQLFAVKSGYVAGFSGPVDLTTGTTPAHNLALTPATTTISGTVADASTSTGLGGIQFFLQSDTGMVTVASTGDSGTYSVPVTAGNWGIQCSEISLSQRGYLKGQSDFDAQADTTSAAATGINMAYPKATALIYGTVTNSSSTPLAGVRIGAGDSTNTYGVDSMTDTAGHYVMGITADTWNVYFSESNPAIAGYVVPANQSLTVSAGQAVQQNFVISTVNAHLQGVVTSTNTSVSGLRVSAYNQTTNQYVTGAIDSGGAFDLGVLAGNWNMQVETSNTPVSIVTSAMSVPVGENQTISGISLAVKLATAQINGYVRDSSGQPIDGNVYAYANIAGLNYNASVQTAGGNYSLPVIDGTWSVGANPNTNAYLNPANVQQIITGTNATVNFILQSKLEAWRSTWFGSTLNSGNGADLNDYDKDGLVNLVEYAFGLNPTQNSAGQLPQPQVIGSNLVVSFTNPAGVAGITYGAESSSTLAPGSWTAIPDTGTSGLHVFSVPLGTHAALFGRLKISSP